MNGMRSIAVRDAVAKLDQKAVPSYRKLTGPRTRQPRKPPGDGPRNKSKQGLHYHEFQGPAWPLPLFKS